MHAVKVSSSLAANDQPNVSSGDDDDSHSLKSNNDVHGGGRRSKLGRTGDPRMHKAVAARMENPNLSLMEALRIGGFNYPEDCGDDGTCMDSDNITLGQRKNQLSRRCRIAKQHQKKSGDESKWSSEAILTHVSTGAQAELREIMKQSSQVQHITSTSGGTRGSKRCASELASELTIPDDDTANMMDPREELTTMRQRMAKFHPQYHKIGVPSIHISSETAAAIAAYGETGSTHGCTWQENQGNVAAQPLIHSTHPAHQPSGVAIASLNATAASVGLTLEQLAVALSSTANLSKVLADQSIPGMKQNLALNLYRSEISMLYRRCMLLAGFTNDEVQDTALAYQQFAFEAWSAEGERLNQQQIGHTSPPDSLSGPAPQKPPADLQHAKAAENANGHSHAHGHAHAHVYQSSNTQKHAHRHFRHSSSDDRACFDGRHVHRLEGKCGHKAVIHKPDGAPAHVDFVVNGKVECYEGIAPVGNNAIPSSAAMWPSRYKCDELSCPTDSHKV